MSKFFKKLTTALLISIFAITSTYAAGLSDISKHQNQTAIQYLYENNVISGYEDGTFKPEKSLNRAELLKILVGGKGVVPTLEEFSNCFPDVKEEWFAPFVCYAKNEGWVSGYPDGTFQPAKEVNKVEALKMLVNSQGYEVAESVTEKLYDDVDSNAWFAPFLKASMDKGLLEETGATFSPSGSMKRAGISENIYRAMLIKEQALESFKEYKNPYSKVTSVVDGDTIYAEIDGEEVSIRLIGVDTPETVHPSKPVECFGKEASKITTEKLLNKEIKLEADESQGDKDKYDRLLRYVILKDGTNFNKWLIENGYAFEYTYDTPYEYQLDFMDAEIDAEIEEKGLWAEGACDADEEIADIPDNTSYSFYVSSKARSKYYCETDPAWENLSTSNLLEYSNEAELLEDFTGLELNQPC